MSLHTFISQHSAKAVAATGLVALLTGCATPEPQHKLQGASGVSDPLAGLTADEMMEVFNKIFFNIPTREELRSQKAKEELQKLREESDQRCIELMKGDQRWLEFYVLTQRLISASATNHSIQFKPTEKDEAFIRKFARLPSDERDVYMNMFYCVLPEVKKHYEEKIKKRGAREPSLADLLFISTVSERLDYFFNFKTLQSAPAYIIPYPLDLSRHAHLHYRPTQSSQSTNLPPPTPFIEEKPTRTKEECIELMKNDASWSESYKSLSATMNSLSSDICFDKLSKEERAYLELFSKLSPSEQAAEIGLLYHIIPDASREEKYLFSIAEQNAQQRKRRVREKEPPNYTLAAQLYVLSEMQSSMRYYLRYGIAPKPPAWLQNREFYRGTRPPLILPLPAAPKQQLQKKE